MKIKVLGPGCAKCKTTYDAISKVLSETGVKAELEKVDDIMEIMKYNVMSTPAVVVDETVRIKGKVPSDKEIREMLGI